MSIIILLGPIVSNAEEVEQGMLDWIRSLRNPRGIVLRAGAYVALTKTMIVSAGRTPDAALEAARRAGVKAPILQRIPGSNSKCSSVSRRRISRHR